MVYTTINGLRADLVRELVKQLDRFQNEFGVVCWCWNTSVTISGEASAAVRASRKIRRWNVMDSER